MVTVTYLPLCVTMLFRGMPGIWKGRHCLMLCWLVVMQALFPGQKTLAELARWTPVQVTAWRFRRLLTASYWHVPLLVAWWAQEALTTLPPPKDKDGNLYLVGDGSDKPKRGTQNPLAQKGRKSEHHPWFFGIRFALLIAQLGRLSPAGSFSPHASHTPSGVSHSNALCRERFVAFPPPVWAQAEYRRRRCRLWLPREYHEGPTARRQRCGPALGVWSAP